MIATASFLVDIGRSLREAFFMFWVTLWPLVLGFGISGAVQGFVSSGTMQRKMGDHRVPAVVRASGYGMASSSCSYAATAMAKSLFVKGADFVSSMVFMFASTNLVIEMGIVLLVLMGWQFAVSEFFGGIVMIVLLATLGALWLRGRAVVEARAHMTAADEPDDHDHVHGQVQPPDNRPGDEENGVGPSGSALPTRLRSRAAWSDSARATMADLTMLRRELVVGYLVAGFLAVLVPESAWRAAFAGGHGFWTSVENVVIGPFIAVISFVCSIGNVPLAAALWKGGISFGGVVSFLFADLITFPLLLIYRRYYGPRMMLRMLVVFWALMSTAGLITEVAFRGVGIVPTARSTTIVSDGFSWNYTTYLNFVFLALFGVLFWLSRTGGGMSEGVGTGAAAGAVCEKHQVRAGDHARRLRVEVRGST